MPILDGGDPWGLPAGEIGVLDGGSPTGLPTRFRDIIDGGGPTGLPYRNDTETVLYLAAREIQDVTGRRWDKIDVLLPYMNEGILEIINLKPDAFVVTHDIALNEGPVQKFPDEMIQFIDFVCNVSDAGVIGLEIRGVIKEFLDQMVPGWMASTPGDTVVFGVVDRRDPKSFYIYPPQPAETTRLIRAKITKQPDQIETVQHELIDLPMDPSYQPALVDYITYRVLSEETTVPGAVAKGTTFYNKFLQDLGLKSQTDKQIQSEGA